MHARGPTRIGRGLAAADLYRGLRDVAGAPFALLHCRDYVGALRLPVAANAVVFAALALGAWLIVAPAYARAFAGEWWLFDGLRRSRADTGPAIWLLTTWLLIGPSVLDTAIGALHEPLRVITERAMLGPPRSATAEPPRLRLRERARILGLALLALPPCLVLALVPWLGLPIVCVVGAVLAAVVWFEPPMAARGLDLRARLDVLQDNRWRALGVGAGIQLAAAVPFVNLLALSACATVAATSAYLQFDKKRVGPNAAVG